MILKLHRRIKRKSRKLRKMSSSYQRNKKQNNWWLCKRKKRNKKLINSKLKMIKYGWNLKSQLTSDLWQLNYLSLKANQRQVDLASIIGSLFGLLIIKSLIMMIFMSWKWRLYPGGWASRKMISGSGFLCLKIGCRSCGKILRREGWLSVILIILFIGKRLCVEMLRLKCGMNSIRLSNRIEILWLIENLL